MQGEAIKSIIHTLGPKVCKHHLLLFPFLGLLFLPFNHKCPWHEGTLMAPNRREKWLVLSHTAAFGSQAPEKPLLANPKA